MANRNIKSIVSMNNKTENFLSSENEKLNLYKLKNDFLRNVTIDPQTEFSEISGMLLADGRFVFPRYTDFKYKLLMMCSGLIKISYSSNSTNLEKMSQNNIKTQKAIESLFQFTLTLQKFENKIISLLKKTHVSGLTLESIKTNYYGDNIKNMYTNKLNNEGNPLLLLGNLLDILISLALYGVAQNQLSNNN